jgi:hypothetical protein
MDNKEYQAFRKKILGKNKPSKMRNVKTNVDGIMFDSKTEARRYCELKIQERTGVISGLELQKRYELIPKQRLSSGMCERACHYVADFVYTMNGQLVCEDRKGMETPAYIIKRKLMKFVHNIEILQTR